MEHSEIVENIARSLHRAHIERIKSQLQFREYSSDLDYLDPVKQNERFNTARFALKCIMMKLDRESSSVLIHNDWISRNKKIATTLQKHTFNLLTEYEKNKYRNIYDTALLHYDLDLNLPTYIS